MNPHAVDSFVEIIADLVAGKIADKLGPATHKSEHRRLDIEQAAVYLGRTTQSLYWLSREGALPTFVLTAGSSLISGASTNGARTTKSMSTKKG